ncbi:MAG: DMT family transporter [Oligoflexia bacterium]|nr:DMT family transporter [Oligoflexia bacterium]
MLKLFELKWFCTLCLVFTSVAWGASFFIIRNSIQLIPSDVFIILRLSLSFIIFFLFFPKRYLKAKKLVKIRGIILGIILFIPIWLQTLGLESISSGRSSFLTSLYVPFTPVLFWLISKEKFKSEHIILVIIALFGSFLMNPFGEFIFSLGDYLTIISAVLFALHIALVGIWTKRHESFELGLWQFVGCFIGALFLILLKSENREFLTTFNSWPAYAWMGILYTSVIATCLCFTLQVICQRLVEPHRAALIFAMEAPLAVFFAFMFNKETLTFNELVGGLMIIAACVLPEKYLRLKKYGPF